MPSAKSHTSKPRPQTRRRTRDYNAEAVSNAKEAIRQFSGELANPIRVESPGPGLYAPENLKREIVRRRSEKINALFAHFGIKATDAYRWMKLSWHLACNFVPGMIPVVEDRAQRKTRRDKNEGFALVVAVDAIRTKIGNGKLGKIDAAVFDLVEQNPKTWGTYRGREDTLIARYHLAKKEIKEQKALSEQRKRLGSVPLGSKEWVEIASASDSKRR